MPNAKEFNKHEDHRILLAGGTGTGKTTQILTLPRPCFAFLFDPNAIMSLRGHDVDYEEFLTTPLNLDVSSLSKKAQEGQQKISKVRGSNVYDTWETYFDKMVESGELDRYKSIAFDSVTTFLDLIMDKVLTLNGRFGQWPQQDDYGPQMVTFMNVCRTLTAMKKTVLFCGHTFLDKDELSQKIYRMPLMTGRLKEKIPLLFTDIFITDTTVDKDGKANYRIQTVPDRQTQWIRTSIKGLEPFEDITLEFNGDQQLTNQGLGGILAWERKGLEAAQ